MIERWEIEVTSDYYRPAKLVEILKKGGAKVRIDRRSFFLSHPYLPSTSSQKEAFERARKLTSSLNFLIRKLHGVPSNLVFKDVVGYDAEGSRHFFARLKDTVVASCEVDIEVRKASGEIVAAPSLPTDRWTDLLLENDEVSLVCQLLNGNHPGWNDLYKAF